MTECPKCKGYGIVGSAVPDILRGRGCIFSSIECPQCHGSGEVEMTNEKWLKSLNTEQLAKWIAEEKLCRGYFIFPSMDEAIQDAVEWLKQPHTKE